MIKRYWLDGQYSQWEMAEDQDGDYVLFSDHEAQVAGLLSALDHMQWCRHCAEGDWADCDGGRAALAAIRAARPTTPGTGDGE